MFVERKEVVEQITADIVELTHQPPGVPPILLESTSAVQIQSKNLEKTPLLLLKILNHCLNDDSPLEPPLKWVPSYKTTWEPHNIASEEAISRKFAFIPRAVPDRYK